MSRPRGRPREYDEDKVLLAAEQVFWRQGFEATSLDDLSSAMGMNRPSMYRAFGDKKAIFRKILSRFTGKMAQAFGTAMQSEAPVQERLRNFFLAALAVYTSGDEPKGCLAMSTAVASAPSCPEIQEDLQAVVALLDTELTTQFRLAIDAGEIPADGFSAEHRAFLAQGLLHTLSVRSRAGDSEEKMRELIEAGTAMLVL